MHPFLGRRLASALLSTTLAVGLAATGATATAAPAAADVRGPDVASHQHPRGSSINWARARADGATFAFVKATEGTGYQNPYFAGDFRALDSLNMVRGAYHFARPKRGAANAVAQARHYVSVAGTMGRNGDLPPVLDLERHDGLKPAALIVWTRAYLQEVQRLTGRTPIIYTYPDFWRTRMANTTAFRGYPLWIATYRARPILVGGWQSHTFWQYTNRARLAGINGAVDMSLFNGSSADLRRLSSPRESSSSNQISAKLSDRSIKLGSSVTLRGSTSRSLAGQKLYRQGYWSGSWHTWATARVSSTGRYSFKIRPKSRATNTYRVHLRSTSKHPAASSVTLKLKVS